MILHKYASNDSDIFSTGIDIVEVARIKKLIDKHPGILDRLLTGNERRILSCRSLRLTLAVSVGKLFAMKEAVLKSVGTGWQEGVSWQDIDIPDFYNCCTISISGKLKNIIDRKKVKTIISSAHGDKKMVVAQAFALIK